MVSKQRRGSICPVLSLPGVLGVMLGSLFLWAGLQKVADPLESLDAFRYFFGSFADTPFQMIFLITSVGGAEISLGIACMILMRSARLWFIVGLVIVLYTLALAALAASPHPPSCGCLGFDLPRRQGAAAGIVRNLGLLLAAGLCASRTRRRSIYGSVRGMPRAAGTPISMDRGFTLIEVLVVLAVSIILIGLALPAISRARGAARLASNTSMLRQIAASVASYGADAQEAFPYLGVVGRPWEDLRIDGEPIQTSFFEGHPPYFLQSRYYGNLLVLGGYFESRAGMEWPSDRGEISRKDPHFLTPYWMTACAFAVPTYWVGDLTPLDLSLYRGARISDCTFPSSKGMILHVLSGIFARNEAHTNAFFAAAVDGSAGPHPMPGDDDLYDNLVARPYGAVPVVTISTRNGLWGRDF